MRVVAPTIEIPQVAHRVNQRALRYYARLTPVLDYVEANLSKPISLDEAARLAGLERKYFSAFFRSKVGTTFTEWITLLRLHSAVERMRVRDESITSVAFAVGFSDVRAFQRAFKRYLGVTPSAFRAFVRPESGYMAPRPGFAPHSSRNRPRGPQARH